MRSFTETDVFQALAATIEEARRLDIRIAVAIVDAGGNLFGFLRMPGSFLASIEYAHWKAWTAAGFGVATSEFAGFLESASPLVREGLVAHPRVTPLPGGLPIRREGQLMGAIGASGGTGEQDELCATAGKRAISAHS